MEHVWDAPVGATGQADIDEAAGLYDAPAEDDATAEAASDYHELTVLDLKDELVARGLTVSGSKAELVERLVADDAKGPLTEADS